jgi:quercetin dioxygenase-like cupin family protein
VERLWFIANLAEVVAERGDLSVVRMHKPAGDRPPLHVHAFESETFYVLEGALTVWVGDREPVTLGPGEAATAPPGLPHTYRAEEPTISLVITNSGSFASFLRAAGRPAERPELPVLDGPPDAERLARVAADHSIEILGPPGMLPSELAAARA